VDLPGTQREADALKHDFPTCRRLHARAGAGSHRQAAGGHVPLRHLASHAFFNDAAPLLSSVVLANPPQGSTEDGFLTAREIFDLTLSADMVVLSACNTARGEKKSGEGIVGLTWALFVAGAPTQVLSQWAVNDASTATLMERFYAGVAKNAPKGASLRQAALALLADKKERRHAHPYYWAPFILVGDWR
jgi:CHAT domain-containing protein